MPDPINDKPSPPPAVNQNNNKAWVAGFVSTLMPILFQNIAGANASFGTIWDWIACGAFGTVCPEGQIIADAFKAIVFAVVGGAATGFATYWISNTAIKK